MFVKYLLSWMGYSWKGSLRLALLNILLAIFSILSFVGVLTIVS